METPNVQTQPRYAAAGFKVARIFLSSLMLSAGSAAALCSKDDPVAANPIEPLIQKDAAAKVRLVEVASGLVAPNWGIGAPGDRKHLFVTDTVGQLWAVNRNNRRKNLVLDVSELMVPLGLFGIGYDERGLLGVAFHPAYAQNGLFYTYTSEPVRAEEETDFPLHGSTAPEIDSRSVITEWKMIDPKAARPKADFGSRRVLMRIDEPQFNHKGGALNFGPDGLLYISLGDGGNADDQGDGHNPDIGNGQDRSTVLGKILRIDPQGNSAPNGQYGIPATNPYASGVPGGGNAGCQDGICDEIWAYGFRNPFRFSFDSRSGALVVGDVGQNSIEEVDVVVRGGNYGWHFREGRFFFQPNGDENGFVSDQNCLNLDTAGLIDPIAQYDHLRAGETPEGIAITGGFVYRGREIPSLKGRYVFGDYSQAFGQALGRLFYINGRNLRAEQANTRTIRELRIQDRETLGLAVFGFGRDAAGELYVLGNTTGVPTLTDQGKTGVVMKLAPVGE